MMSVNQGIGKRNVGQNRVGGYGGMRSPSFLCVSPSFWEQQQEPHTQESL